MHHTHICIQYEISQVQATIDIPSTRLCFITNIRYRHACIYLINIFYQLYIIRKINKNETQNWLLKKLSRVRQIHG